MDKTEKMNSVIKVQGFHTLLNNCLSSKFLVLSQLVFRCPKLTKSHSSESIMCDNLWQTIHTQLRSVRPCLTQNIPKYTEIHCLWDVQHPHDLGLCYQQISRIKSYWSPKKKQPICS